MPIDVDALAIRGHWVRHSRHPTNPLPERDPVPDSRWQRGSVVDALYLADEPATAWAEWYRHLAELGLPPDQWLPTHLWTWRVETEVADLSDAERLARVGLQPPRPGRHTWPPCQAIGEELHRAGWPGLLAPSAARPAGRVLCLFRTAGTLTAAEPVSPPELVTRAPVPPRGMVT